MKNKAIEEAKAFSNLHFPDLQCFSISVYFRQYNIKESFIMFSPTKQLQAFMFANKVTPATIQFRKNSALPLIKDFMASPIIRLILTMNDINCEYH